MSLFPAYTVADEVNEVSKEKGAPSWLENESFQAVQTGEKLEQIQPVDVKGLNVFVPEFKPKEVKSDRKRLASIEYSYEEKREIREGVFTYSIRCEYTSCPSLVKSCVINLSQIKDCTFFSISTHTEIIDSDKPLYEIPKSIQKSIGKQGKSYDRYYVLCANSVFAQEEYDQRMQEWLQMAGHYNRILAADTSNVEDWLNYVKLQDKCVFDGDSRRGYHFAIAEKKIAILNKALLANPGNEKLLFWKYNIMNLVSNFDEINEELLSNVKKDSGNIVLWKSLICTTQYSLSRCTVPAILDLYSKAMEKIKTSKSGGIFVSEQNILDLYQQCGIFLRQAGLWEQLCVLIQLYLQTNLAQSQNAEFKYTPSIPQKTMDEYEEAILSSGLPVLTMWLRFERIRQKVHWYPHSDAGNCEDPQRVVFTSDMAHLLQMITSSNLDIQLAVYTLALLKVPMLPFRQCSFIMLHWDKIPWFLDSSEVLLAGYFHPGFLTVTVINEDNNILITSLKNLVSSPQYVNNNDLGQEQYQEFIYTVFKYIVDNIQSDDCQTAVLIWWIRFERFLLTLEENRVSKLSSRSKRFKNTIKDLLKQEKHRNNVLLYIEYALLEKELSDSLENCFRILKTASSIYPDGVYAQRLESSAKVPRIALYRVYCQLLLSDDKRQECLDMLVSICLGEDLDRKVDDKILEETSVMFKDVTTKCLNCENFNEQLTFEDLILPQFTSEWIICWTLFRYLTESLQSALSHLQQYIDGFLPYSDENLVIRQSYYRELLSEMRVSLLDYESSHNVQSNNYKLTSQDLNNYLTEYPNNMYFLNVYANRKVMSNGHWFPMYRTLYYSDSCLARTMLVLTAISQYVRKKKFDLKLLNSSDICCLSLPCFGEKNKLNSIFRNIEKDELLAHCPLLWQLYLQFVGKYKDMETCKNIFYMAIEKCPWAKMLYTEAVNVAPGEFSRVQELLVEKELRLFITPEEIEELRD